MNIAVASLEEKFTCFIYSTDYDFLDTSEMECDDYRFDLDDGEHSVWVRARSDGLAELDGSLPPSLKSKFTKWAKTNKVISAVEFI